LKIFSIIFGGIIFLAIYGIANFYIAKKINLLISLHFTPNKIVFAGIYISFIIISLIIIFLPPTSSVNRIIHIVGCYFMAVSMYMLMFFLVTDLFILLGKNTNIIQPAMLNGTRFYSGLAVVLLSAAIICYGAYNDNKIEFVSYEIQLKDAVMNNMKIILISDSHLGSVNNTEKNLERIVQGINNLAPDIVCIPGDIFNDNINGIRNPDRAIALLKSIESTYGVYASLGNHDRGNTFDQMVSFLERSNIKLLNDEYVIIDERLALFGRIDSSPLGGFGNLQRQDISDLIASVGKNMPVVIMDHDPANIKEYGSDVDLILSGHTHGGQVFPATLFRNIIFTVGYGYYQKDGNSPQVIVTSGVGAYGPPMRIGTNNEIVSVILK